MIRIKGFKEEAYATKEGTIYIVRKGVRVLAATDPNSERYLRVWLTREEEEKNRRFMIHKVVYEAFFGPIPDGYEVDHKDNNRQNNKLSNLRLLPRKTNRGDIRFKGKSERIKFSAIRLVPKEISNPIAVEFTTIKAAAAYLNVSKMSVKRALNRNTKSCGGHLVDYVF